MKVVVIGAGVAGLGVGWKLARAGASVTVLERSQVGNGATTASGGMIAAAAELGRAGSPEAALAQTAKALWPAFRDDLEKESKVEIGYRRNGALLVRMRGEAQRAHQALSGVTEALDASEARVLEPLLGEGIDGAVLAPQEAEVDSQALCRALAVSFVRAGGQVLSNEAAVRFEFDGRRVTGIATPFGVHRADIFVLAMGAWSSRIEGLPREVVPPITPVKGEIVVLTPPPGSAVPNHVIWGNGIYAVPRGDRLLVGATMELAGFDTILTQAALRWLYRQSTGLMPGLASWRLVEHWAGLRPASPDGLPLLGQTAVEGLYVASGQFRNGILFAPAVAEGLSRLILDRTAVDPAFDPRRFEGNKPSLSVAETPHKDVSGEARVWRTGF
jgi:glycine oxidase